MSFAGAVRAGCFACASSLIAALGCGSSKGAFSTAAARAKTPASIAVAPPQRTAEIPADPPPIPITSADPSWGNPDAPVTLVWFDDLECPFCARAAPVIAEVEARYGPDKLRVVHKNFPLPFHAEGGPAAEVAVAVYEHGGSDAFRRFREKVFADQKAMSRDQYRRWSEETGVAFDSVDLRIRQGGPKSKVSADIDLGKSIGVVGTPCFFVNGVQIVGAQPLDEFVKEIDRQLSFADQLIEHGVPRASVHLVLTKAQIAQGSPPTPGEDAAPDDTGVYRVPIGDSPVRGPAGALVTVVEFTDFECPFCRSVQATLDELRRRYGRKIRIVFKHNPLPFHAMAEPAARLTIEARKQKGDLAFWRAHDAIWAANEQELSDATLERIGVSINLDVAKLRRAMSENKHAEVISADRDLAKQLSATGTPTFFLNGRRLVGAQPIEKFTAIVDEEIKTAQELLSGKPRTRSVYDELQKQAKSPQADAPR
jgi:protein-disulfide isomerase